MVGAVVQGSLQSYHRITRQGSLLDAVAQALFHRREEALRHRAAYDPLGKFQRIAVARLEFDPHITELSVAAGLLLVPPLVSR